MSATDITAADAPTRRPANRRELILEAAVELFHRHGYPATSVDDIGKAVDVSGPAIYRHFSSKEDLLVEAITLAADEVHAVNRVARADTDDPRALLTGYIRAYTDVALERSALIAVWTSERRHLSRERRSPVGRRLRSWTLEWTDALQAARPELDDNDAFLLVTAAIGLITSVATGPDRRDDPHLAENIVTMALATLDAPVR